MANKYIIHGATYNGDGTTSSEAASNGAAGAWNTITYFEGTTPAYGTLAAGDIVYIRSKDSAGADITRSATTLNLGSTAATVGSPIYWIIDNGVTWSGIDGLITYNITGNSTVATRANNPLHVLTRWALKIVGTSTSNSKVYWQISNNVKGVYFKGPVAGYITAGYLNITPGIIAEDCYIEGDAFSISPNASNQKAFATLINPTIKYNYVNVRCFCPDYNGYGLMKVIGGKVYGDGATTGSALVGDSDQGGSLFEFVGFEVPRTMDIVNPSAGLSKYLEVRLTAADGNYGGHFETLWGYATSRTDNYPPYLDAAVPDSVSTKWSWRVYAKRASSAVPMVLPTLKFYSGSAATKTITQEILVANTVSATKNKMWMCVDYVDSATGAQKHITTQDYTNTGTLDTSTANWLPATTWGLISFNKYKLELTTPTSIKQDSPITVTLISTITPASANDVYFVNPDFAVS